MMWKTQRYAYASALPAIAAALALSSTPAWSQDVQPTAEPAPVTVETPPPVVDTAPAPATETTTTVTDPTPAVEPVAAAPTPAPKPKAKPAAPKASTPSASKSSASPRVASAAPAKVAPATTPVATAQTPPQPVADPAPVETAQATSVPEAKPSPVNEDALMIGGGALALLALGGGAIAMTRRRREEDEIVEETVVDEPVATAPEPVVESAPVYEEQPAIVAPSAFAWGNAQPSETFVERNDGETWVERAHRGPTPDNPSLSLRKRLKRAAFFDAREKRVEAGKADPVAADAGLPENVANDIHERELELA